MLILSYVYKHSQMSLSQAFHSKNVGDSFSKSIFKLHKLLFCLLKQIQIQRALLEMLVLKSILAVGHLSLSVAATSWIVPGAVWTDTKGQKIDAHGGGIVKVGSTFYWSGQSASTGKSCLSRLSL
jgi:hypothetical protein